MTSKHLELTKTCRIKTIGIHNDWKVKKVNILNPLYQQNHSNTSKKLCLEVQGKQCNNSWINNQLSKPFGKTNVQLVTWAQNYWFSRFPIGGGNQRQQNKSNLTTIEKYNIDSDNAEDNSVTLVSDNIELRCRACKSDFCSDKFDH